MVELVRSIREHYPNITIIVNRGFSIVRDITPYIDYLLFEDFVTYYDFDSGRYKIFNENNLQWEFAQIQKLKSLNVSMLVLSYANMSNESQMKKFSSIICRYAEKYNISEVYLTDVSLLRIGLNPCERRIKYQKTTLEPMPTGTSSKENKRAICGPVIFLLLVILTRFTSR